MMKIVTHRMTQTPIGTVLQRDASHACNPIYLQLLDGDQIP